MNKLAVAFVAINFASVASKAAAPEINPSHIDVYVTPYYGAILLRWSNDRCYAVCYGRLPGRLKASLEIIAWDSSRFGQNVMNQSGAMSQARRE